LDEDQASFCCLSAALRPTSSGDEGFLLHWF
jgi:hypothetical protein